MRCQEVEVLNTETCDPTASDRLKLCACHRACLRLNPEPLNPEPLNLYKESACFNRQLSTWMLTYAV